MTRPTAPREGPQLVVAPGELAGIDRSAETMAAIPGSRMFEIRKALGVFRQRDPEAPTYDASQGDGGESLAGVPGVVLDEAHRLQREHGTGYDQPYGTDVFRRVVAEDYWRLDAATGWGPANVIACQGGRDALVKAYDAVQVLGARRRGDFVLVSRVPWISYNWGPYSVGANVMLAPGREEDAWAIAPEAVSASVEAAARHGGRRVAMLVITSPDNPTGAFMPEDRQLELARAAFAAGVGYVLFDWIYHRVTDREPFDLNRVLLALSPAERDRCIFLDGITKSLGASNVRNAHLVASERLVSFVSSRASHAVIPSFHSQAVAIAAYRMGLERAAAEIIGPTNESRAVLRSFLEAKGMRHIVGQGYYAFIDAGSWIDRGGLGDSAGLGAVLAERHGLAVVPGVYFSDFGARWLRFSYALPPERTRAAAERLWQGLEAIA